MLNPNISAYTPGRFLQNVRIGPKITLGFLALIALMGIIVGAAFWGIWRIQDADTFALKRQGDVANLETLKFYMVKQYQNQADYIINGDSKSIDDFKANAKAMDEHKLTARGSADMVSEEQLFSSIDQLDSQFDAVFLEQIVPAQKAGQKDLVLQLDGQSDKLMTDIETYANKLINSYTGERDKAEAQSKSTNTLVIWLLVVISLASAALGLTTGIALTRTIAGPVQIVSAVAAHLAQGDVEQSVPVSGQDEIGQMASAFRQMIVY